MCALLSVREAAKILGFSSIRYTRDKLGEPDAVEKSKITNRFMYTAEHINAIKEKIQQSRVRRQKNRGKVSCYICRNVFDKEVLKSGICPKCRAMKTIRNFICSGDCMNCSPDDHLLELLHQTLHEYEQKK